VAVRPAGPKGAATYAAAFAKATIPKENRHNLAMTPGKSTHIATYADFWLFYLRQHARPATRALHYIGTALVVGLLIYGCFVNAWALAAVPFAGYGFAWAAHLAVEHNRPATFTHPWWSLISDFRMFALFVTGRLGVHLDNAGVRR
jgi:hypothetical protein